MLQKALFPQNTSREKIIEAMRNEGFEPKLITDKPGFIYEIHQHPETKLLVCLEGSMKVNVAGEEILFESGDELKIPGNTEHSAVVGDKGCVFFWSEKLV
jgi:quercetin dioxygenase-like cupin family protein